MSTPTAPASSRTPAWLKWLLGCTIGGFVLVLLCCAGACLGGKALFGGLFSKLQRAEAETGLARAASERVAGLDLEFPSRLPEDVAAAELTPEDVDRYLRVRRALQPQAEAFQKVVEEAVPKSGGALGVVTGVVGLVGASVDATEARRVLLDAAEPALRAESLGPTDLERMAQIVEWRFLRRPEARFLGLEQALRREYMQRKMEERLLEAWTQGAMPPGMKVNNRTREESAQDLQRLRERLAELDKLADANTALSGATLAALELRRADLESLSTAGLEALAPLTAQPALIGLVNEDGDFQIGAEKSWPPESSRERADEAAPENGSSPDGPSSAPEADPAGTSGP